MAIITLAQAIDKAKELLSISDDHLIGSGADSTVWMAPSGRHVIKLSHMAYQTYIAHRVMMHEVAAHPIAAIKDLMLIGRAPRGGYDPTFSWSTRFVWALMMQDRKQVSYRDCGPMPPATWIVGSTIWKQFDASASNASDDGAWVDTVRIYTMNLTRSIYQFDHRRASSIKKMLVTTAGG